MNHPAVITGRQLNLFSRAHMMRIHLERKNLLFMEYRNYVLHKKRIILNSKRSYYGRSEIRESLEVLLRYLEVIPDYKLRGICMVIIKQQYHLENILPLESNTSYQSSLQKFNQLINLSHIFLKNVNY